MLIELGFEPGIVDGWWGNKTDAAVTQLQIITTKLDGEGQIGKKTFEWFLRVHPDEATKHFAVLQARYAYGER